jgi:hypothetical protein
MSSKERIYEFKMKLLVNEFKIIMKEKHTWAQTMTGIVWACFVFVLSSRCHRCQMCMVGDVFGDMLIVVFVRNPTSSFGCTNMTKWSVRSPRYINPHFC